MFHCSECTSAFIAFWFGLRESMITAHQCRIEQLQSSYREKLEQAEGWPGKVNFPLRRIM